MADRSQLTPHRPFVYHGISGGTFLGRQPPIDSARVATRQLLDECSNSFFSLSGGALRKSLAEAAFAVGMSTGAIREDRARIWDRHTAFEKLWRAAYLCGLSQKEAEAIARQGLADGMANVPKPIYERDDPKARTGKYRGLKLPWTSETRPTSPGRPKGSKNRRSRKGGTLRKRGT
jgi:hypothetical protein